MDGGAEVSETEKPEHLELSLFCQKSSFEALSTSAFLFSEFSSGSCLFLDSEKF